MYMNYKVGAVIGYDSSCLLFETWLASFIRRLQELVLIDDVETNFIINNSNSYVNMKKHIQKC